MEKSIISRILIERCPECGSSDLVHDYDKGETICAHCGLVIKEQEMDKGPEWRAFTLEEKMQRSRIGTPENISVPDKGLSTTIRPWELKKNLPASTRAQMWRLRKRQIRARVNLTEEQNLARAMAKLTRLSNKLDIPKQVKEEAAFIYRKALKKKLIRGRSTVAMVTASLYVACRLKGIPRSLNEISKASLVKKKDVASCYRLLLRKLSLKMPIATPLIYIPKIAEKSGISGTTERLALRIFHQAQKKPLITGKSPRGLAAAVLYIACQNSGEKKTQKEISKAAGITEVTLRNICRQLGLPPKFQLKDLKERGLISLSFLFNKKIVSKYLSALSGKTVTTFLYFLANLKAAKTLAPEEIPTNKPCSLAKFLAIEIASLLLIFII